MANWNRTREYLNNLRVQMARKVACVWNSGGAGPLSRKVLLSAAILGITAAVVFGILAPLWRTWPLRTDFQSGLRLSGIKDLSAKNLSPAVLDSTKPFVFPEPVAQLQSLFGSLETRPLRRQEPFFPLQWILSSWPTRQLVRFPLTFEQDKPLLRVSRADEFWAWAEQNSSAQGNLPASCPAHWPLTLGWSKVWEKSSGELRTEVNFQQLESPLLVFDGPVDWSHPELREMRSLGSRNFPESNPEVVPDTSRLSNLSLIHDTHTASLIAAPQEGRGVSGILPGFPVSFAELPLEADERSILLSTVVRHLNRLDSRLSQMSPQPRVLLFNLAFLSSDPSEQKLLRETLSAALRPLLKKELIIVVPAGNRIQGDGSSLGNETAAESVLSYPSELADLLSVEKGQLLSVGASDFCSKKAWFSLVPAPSLGRYFFAPGERIYSALPNGDYGYLSGTSQAAAQVAALLSLGASAAPHLSPKELIHTLVGASRHAPGLGERGVVPDAADYWDALSEKE